MSDLRELYQQVIVDHARRPRNRGRPDTFTHEGHGHNPLCGDKLVLWLALGPDGRIAAARFEGEGCAISTSSASLLTEAVTGMSQPEAEALFQAVHALVTTGEVPDGGPDLGKLEVFAGVHEFPARVKCASLAWHTMHAALAGQGVAQTE